MPRKGEHVAPPNRPPAAVVALTEVPPLTDEQRAAVAAFYEANPDGGYKQALAHAGIHATKAAAKAAIVADDDLPEHIQRCLKVDEHSLLKRLGAMSADAAHKDSLRATTFALAALHGYREKSETVHTGPDGGPMEVTNPDVAAAIDRLTALTAGALRAAQREGTRELARELEPGTESGARLRVAPVDRPA